jgi:hypothetical protein
MSWQLWDPPAIIIPAPAQEQIQIQAQQQQQLTDEQHFRKIYDQPWNKLHSDGRINIDGESSASVSPYSEHFRSQVETGIWPLVEALYTRGYLPVSSCAGHRSSLLGEWDTLFQYRSEPYVSIAVHRDLEQSTLNSIRQLLIKHATVSSTHSQANMNATTTRIRHARTTIDTAQEYAALNWQLQRNYTAYSYINIRINPWSRFNPLHVLRTQREHTLILEQAREFERLERYSL